MYVDIKFTVIFQGARVDISVKGPLKTFASDPKFPASTTVQVSRHC